MMMIIIIIIIIHVHFYFLLEIASLLSMDYLYATVSIFISLSN